MKRGVREQEERTLQRVREPEVPLLERRLVQLDEPLDQTGVVVQKSGRIAASLPVDPPQPPGRLVEELGLDERRRFRRGIQTRHRFGRVDFPQDGARARQGPDRQPVPRHDDLVVQGGARAVALAVGAQPPAPVAQDTHDRLLRHTELLR